MSLTNHINQLFAKYLNRTISAAELEELVIFLQGINERDSETLEESLQELWKKAKSGELPSTAGKVNWKEVYANVTAVEKANEKTKEEARVVPMKRRWMQIAAASVVLLVGAYFLFNYKSNKSVPEIVKVETRQPENVLPGSNRAVLVLADGREIMLDSAKNGSLAVQGTTAITNENGKIVYTAGKGGEPVTENTLSTKKGNKYQLQLPDGSLVWLNALSSITYPVAFTGNERKVKITGEAYFEVAKVPGKKFVVIYNDLTTEVLGTHFNVNSYSDEAAVKVTLLEGSVKVTKQAQTVLLKPGEQAQASATLTSQQVNTDLSVAWVKGYFQFDKADVKTILREASRWYNLDIVYEGTVQERVFSGKLERNLSLAGFLRLFREANIHFRIEGNTMIVTP